MKVSTILKNIEILRNLMHIEAKEKGINHQNVIKISQQLDKQIVKFYNFK